MKRPQRLLAILVALQANQQMTAAELAYQFGVSSRTILRDIDALVAADVPVVAERGRYGGITLLRGSGIDVSRLTRTEAEALGLLGVDVAKARQLGIEVAVRSAADKLAPRSPRRWHQAPSDQLSLGEVVAIDSEAWFAAEDSAGVAGLASDLRLGRRLRIDYRRSGEQATSERVVDPYGVYSRGGRWYLVAARDGEPRLYAVARLASWAVLDEPRHIDPDVTLAEVAKALVARLEDSRGVVVSALLDAGMEDMVRRILGNRLLSVESTSDPRTVRITVGYEQLGGVRQLLQFPDGIDVIGPAEARELMRRLAEQIADRHRCPRPASPG